MKLKDKDIYQQYMYNYPHKKAYRNIENVDILNLKDKIERDKLGLYIHIPFCRNRCGYCNLFSLSGNNYDLMKKYIDEIEIEAKYYRDNFNIEIDNFILGGGTPLYLDKVELERVLSIPKKYFGKSYEEIYIAIETSPKDTTEDKLKLLKKYSVDRVSIGIQSFIDSELISLKRNHREIDIKKSLELLKKYKFPILNIDLIYGIENQTTDSFLYSIKKSIEYNPEEIFLYPLYIRENKTLDSSEIDRYKLYKIGRKYLLENGYTQQSMRRFSKINRETNTCGFSNSIALGVGGRSYIDNLHYCREYSDNQKRIKILIEEYINDKEKNIIKYGILLDEDERKRIFLIRNLFTVEGLPIEDYKKTFKNSIFSDFKILNTWIENKYYYIENNYLKPTELGISLADYLGPQLISENIKIKMDNWTEKYG